MGKYIDLTGRRYGKLTVIRRSDNNKEGRAQWLCKCDCGNDTIVCGKFLRNGHTKSCGKCIHRGIEPENLVGKRFGRLLVTKYHGNGSHTSLWECKCDCGNHTIVSMSNLKRGHTSSCGCLAREKSRERIVEDLTGMVFGRWAVLELDHKDDRGQNIWKCQCECGNIGYVSTGVLKSGGSRSCGCLKSELTHERCFVDLAGQKFGKLTAIRRVGTTSRRAPIWECFCGCGNKTFVPTHHLMSGHTQSCGCEMSFGEYSIIQFLQNHKINYVTQKRFLGCVDIAQLRFDFWLPDYGVCIEYDGEMHYQVTSLGNDLENQQRRDEIKTKYCEENGIVLLRIPYWEKKN